MLVAHGQTKRMTTRSLASLVEGPIGVFGVAIPEGNWVGEAMALISTAWGYCGVVWKNSISGHSASGFEERVPGALLCRILTPGLSQTALRRTLLSCYPGCPEVMGDARGKFHPEVVPEWFGVLQGYLQDYYSSGLRAWTMPQFQDNWTYWNPRLDWLGLTAFQRNVLEVVAGIHRGTSLTYGQVAAKIGRPQASRAVGMAVGSNPWPVLVPCHRVLGSKGKLTGFSAPGGVATKRRMLAMEGAKGLFD